MAWGPLWATFPLLANGKRRLGETQWNAVIDNFANAKGDRNGGGFKLTNNSQGYFTDLVEVGNNRLQSNLLSINVLGTGNRQAEIRLYGDNTYAAGAVQFYREPSGIHADTSLIHRGNGVLKINASDAGDVALMTSNTTRLMVHDNGNITIGSVTNAGARLSVIDLSSIEEQVRWSNNATNYYRAGRRTSDGHCVFAGNQASPFCGFVFAPSNIPCFWLDGPFVKLLGHPVFTTNALAAAGGVPVDAIYSRPDGSLWVRKP